MVSIGPSGGGNIPPKQTVQAKPAVPAQPKPTTPEAPAVTTAKATESGPQLAKQQKGFFKKLWDFFKPGGGADRGDTWQ